jgi:ATP-dependent helicase/nuclease subunit A
MVMRASALKRRQDRRLAEKELAERKRLFYVACTRAKDHLVLCGHRPEQRSLAREGRDWMVWTWQTLGLGENDLKAGGKMLGEAEDVVDLRITTAAPFTVARAEEPGPLVVPSDWPAWQPARPHPVEPTPRMVLRPSRGLEPATSLEDIKGFATSARTETPEMRGEIAHEVLQGKDATMVLLNFGQEDPRGDKARKLTEVRERFLNTPLMRDAEVDRKEQPFEIVLDGKMCIGRMDRLVRTKDGQWYLIDFKTGMVSRSRAKEKVKEHAPQMAVYRRAAEAIVGHPVRSMIYFTDGAFFEEVR